MSRRDDAPTPARRSPRLGRANWTTLAIFPLAALGVFQFHRPSAGLVRHRPLALSLGAPAAVPSLDAFGASGEVRVRFSLAGGTLEFPLEVRGDPVPLRYAWVPASDTTPVEGVRTLTGASVVAPARPGFYRLALVSDSARRIIDQPLVAVMVPFRQKVGAWLNGYRIGTYLGERFGPGFERPEGFVEVRREDLDLYVSRHFRLADFVTRDAQDEVWPKYVALDPRLLDKLELVLARIREENAAAQRMDLAPDVHSGFRTPAHNAGVLSAARDSRHQYGDAADVAIDANGDGRVTVRDEQIIARAVEAVEDEHPELVGGLGLYTSRRYRTPYVHIDARGTRSRWRG